MSACPIFHYGDDGLLKWLDRAPELDPGQTSAVAETLRQVKGQGAAAVLESARKFDAAGMESLFVTADELAAASVSEAHHDAIKKAIDRVTEFHETQLGVVTLDWEELNYAWAWETTATERPGGEADRPKVEPIGFGKFKLPVPDELTQIPERVESGMLGQRLIPLRRVGVYAPGGKASYPSSVIMNAIPAKVARVREIVLATPPQPDGTVHPAVLVAARECGIEAILKCGGAAAMAAFAYGIEGMPRVDKIVGPGNSWVNEAKRQLWGMVGLDGLAGPSEVCVLALPEADPVYAAADLLAQLEHSEDNVGLVVCFSREQADEILESAKVQMLTADRSDVLRRALQDHTAVAVCDDLAQALEIVNRFAPEHLALLADDAAELLPSIVNAGCIALGHTTPQSSGDFASGPSHTLPTNGAARFASPVNVQDFLRFQSVSRLERGDVAYLMPIIDAFAEMEGFPAHAASARARLKS